MQTMREELEEMLSEGVRVGACRPHAGSCRPQEGLYFSFECDRSPGRVCTEEGCDQACVLKQSIVAECTTDFREAGME